MENTHESWMHQALDLARLAGEKGEVPIGAILVHNEKIIGSGENKRETLNQTCAHAEIQAIEAYNNRYKSWRLPKGTSLYVTAEPCVMCTGALIWARVDQVYYGCQDPKNAGIRTLESLIEEGRFDHRMDSVQGQVLESECAETLRLFFQKRRSGEFSGFSKS